MYRSTVPRPIIISTMLISSTSPAGTRVSPQAPPATRRPTPRMLDIAEQIETLIEAGVWTPATFPTSMELKRLFHAKQETVSGALHVNVSRGHLAVYADPDSGHPRPRFLPRRPESSPLPATGPERVAMIVIERVQDGRWNANNFPTTRQIVGELGCGHGTVEGGMKIAEARGVIIKAHVPATPPARGRRWAWRPATLAPELPPYERISTDIRSGVLAGQLPTIKEMGRKLRIDPTRVSDAYRQLAQEGLIYRRFVRSKRGGTPRWYVVEGNASPGYAATNTDLAPGSGPPESQQGSAGG